MTLRTARLHTPPNGMLDAGLRHRPFPDDTASLLPGPLTATRTGLTPASDDKLANQPSTIYMINLQLSGRTKGHRYPVEIINHCVWLYFRFPLSFREVEELMLVRGVAVSYETIRRWCAKFGQAYANQLRRRRPRPGDKWHLDEVFVGINGRLRYLWRAVDQHGNVLDVLVQSRRNAVAAKRFFRKLLKGLRYVPRVLVTDKLGSYQVAHRELMSSVEHRRSRYLNNRAENSHQPTRQRERAMKRFKSLRHAQRFLSAFSGISAHFRPRRHLLSATEWRTEMADRFAVWRQVTAPDAAA